MFKTRLVKAHNPKAIQQAVTLLRQGKVIALPTDTVYGVGALAFNAAAVAQIYAVKNRPPEKAIPVFIASLAQLDMVCGPILNRARDILQRYWPGGLTAVLPASPRLPGIVTHNGPTVAVRIPNHPTVLNLLAQLNEPLAVSSANLSGMETPPTAQGVQAQLQGRLPLIIDDGPSPSETPSTIIDLTAWPPKILRQGAALVSF